MKIYGDDGVTADTATAEAAFAYADKLLGEVTGFEYVTEYPYTEGDPYYDENGTKSMPWLQLNFTRNQDLTAYTGCLHAGEGREWRFGGYGGDLHL